MDGSLIDELFQQSMVPREKFPVQRDPYPNEYFIIRNQSKKILATYIAEEKAFKHIQKRRAYGIEPRNAEQTFSLDALFNEDIPPVTMAGRREPEKPSWRSPRRWRSAPATSRYTLPDLSCPCQTATSGNSPGTSREARSHM